MDTEKPVTYFPNAKGDYTISLHGEPVGYTQSEKSASSLISAFNKEIERIKGTLGAEGLKQLIEAKELLQFIRKEIVQGSGMVNLLHAEYDILKRIENFLKPKP